MENLKHVLESLLFVADEPLTLERLKKIVREAESREIRQALKALQEEYRQRRGGFDLREIAGGYQFRSRNVYNEWITRLIEPSPVRLSKAALETLAIIAYKQPVIRSDVEHIRGVDCGGVLRVLLERQLIRVLGRREIPGRPLIYATTKKFLEVFDLKDLKDLPSPKEIETFGQAINDGQVEVVESDETDAEASAAPSGDTGDASGASTVETGDAADLSQEPGDSAAGHDDALSSSEAAPDEDPAAEKAPAAEAAVGEADARQPETRAEIGEETNPDRSSH
jgi:segregation and condensation protein B